MNIGNIGKHKVLMILALGALAVAFSFFYRMYHDDINALTNFVASYERFDKAMSDFSISKTDDTESEASVALSELNIKAAFRISSLIKNEKELMAQAREVADISGRELDTLKAYKAVVRSKNVDMNALAKEYGDLTSARKAAYANFWQLGPAGDKGLVKN